MMPRPRPARRLRAALRIGCVGLLGLTGCAEQAGTNSPRPVPAATAPSADTRATAAEPRSPASSRPRPTAKPAARRRELVLIAAGDVSFGRLRGRVLLQDPSHNHFAPLRALLQPADLRFVNLESQLSDQGGETVSPINKLVFVGPPAGAGVLKAAQIDIVSLGNNHAWDYGKAALFETFDHLDHAGVAYVGAGRDRDQAYAPRVIAREGFRVAFLAVTHIWNQGLLRNHPGRDHVADAELSSLVTSIQRAKALPDVDAVVVSYHGGYEYFDTPHEGTRELLRAAVAAGADVVLGHHPHVLQRIEIVDGKPIFYSLGNLLMRMTTGQPWTEWGALARVTLSRARPPEAAICPFRIHGFDPVPLAGDPLRDRYESFFRFRFERLLAVARIVAPESEVVLGEFEADGCAPIRRAAPP